MKLMTFFGALSLLLLSSGCFSLRPYNLTPFPAYQGRIESPAPAVISHNPLDGTYVVSERMVNNAVINQIYIDAIHEWKRKNAIR